jgi:hypothetical protein
MPSVLGGRNCEPPSQLVTISSGGPRPLLGTPASGTATRAVLAFFLEPRVGIEQKMILRMSGNGPLTMQAKHNDEASVEITRIDTSHGSSTYDSLFPGTTEFGLLFTFPKPGCWQLDVRRADAAAAFYVVVG